MAVQRNDPCPCGSGKKYKRCCMNRADASGSPGPGGAVNDVAVASLLAEAQAHHEAERLDRAAAGYEAVLTRDTGAYGALIGLGQIRSRLGASAVAVGLFERALRAEPRLPGGFVNLGAELQRQGRIDEALEHLERAIELAPEDTNALYVASTCYEQTNRLDEAIEFAERAERSDPGNIDVETALARMQRRAGKLDQARDRLNALALRLGPGDIDRASRVWTELGFVRDKLGEHDPAFDAFRRAGEQRALTAEARRLDGTVWGRWMEASKAAFTPERLARGEPAEEAGPRLVFLVGFPRSGTTMLEQVLAAHPGVMTTDEQPFLLDVRKSMTGETPGPVFEMLDGLGPDGLAAARRQYRDAVAAWNPDGARCAVLVDKQPLNIIEVGWINLLFPDARILLAMRDPRDVCLSCFMQRFTLNSALVNFLDWKRTAVFYADVMSFWMEMEPRLTVPVLWSRYEDTVTDFQVQARRLVDFIGLDWDDDVLRFHEKARNRRITTPSFEAVARPVSRGAMGRWHRYARHYEQVSADLQPFIEAFGYGADAGGSAP